MVVAVIVEVVRGFGYYDVVIEFMLTGELFNRQQATQLSSRYLSCLLDGKDSSLRRYLAVLVFERRCLFRSVSVSERSQSYWNLWNSDHM